MKVTGIQITFFCVIWVAIIFVSIMSLMVAKKMTKQYLTILIIIAIAAVITGLLWGLFYWAGVCKKSDQKSKDNFNFEVTPEKLCDGGPYMWSEKNAKMCSELSNDKYYKYNCQGGLYNGRPVNFEYTPLSDDEWENSRCTGNNDDFTDQVL